MPVDYPECLQNGTCIALKHLPAAIKAALEEIAHKSAALFDVLLILMS